MKLLTGNKIAERIYGEIRMELSAIIASGLQPRLLVVLVGDDAASLSYIDTKRKKAAELGVIFDFKHFNADVPQEELCRQIVELNRTPGACGIIIQLPLPVKYARQQVLDCVLPGLDIDGLTSANQTRLTSDTPAFVPPTPAAVIALLEAYAINLNEAHVLIVGAGDLVGKPLAKILMHRGITVSVATSGTGNLSALTKSADVIITGVGKPRLITGAMVKKGAVIVDAGTSFLYEGGDIKLVGDVDFDSVSPRASALTPVPGGVGPLTVAMLFKNLIISARRMLS